MPKKDVRKKLRRATVLYWTLLIYIVAALVWWFISLEKQNDNMRELRITRMKTAVDSNSVPALYRSEVRKISRDYKNNRTKYIGEGSIFPLVIFVRAGLVYQFWRRKISFKKNETK